MKTTKNTVQNLPKGMQEILITCDIIRKDMMKNHSMTYTDAENAILELLQENAVFLQNGKYNKVNNSLKNIFKELF